MSHCHYMPTITIYLTNELYDKIKNSPSKIVRAALEKYFKIEHPKLNECDEIAQK